MERWRCREPDSPDENGPDLVAGPGRSVCCALPFVVYSGGMTKTESTPKTHNDGGTYITIAFAETRNRWGVAITRWTTYRDEIRYEVKRVSDDNRAFRLGHFATESEARSYANKMWARDR